MRIIDNNMGYREDYDSLKHRIHDAKKIWEDFNDGRDDDEKEIVVSQQMTEALHDNGVIFHYGDSGTMLPVYDEFYVFDRDTDNLVLESGEFGEPNKILFNTISQSDLDEIKAIIHSNQWLLEVRQNEITEPARTDGTVQEFFFCDGNLNNYFVTNNYGFQNTFDDGEKDRKFKQVVERILNILKKEG